MQSPPDVADTIRIAVAPVFLLSGIGALLAVQTSRLARIVDRARDLEVRVPADQIDADDYAARLAVLSRRAVFASRAITLCTVTAVLVCCVIAILFLSAFWRFHAATLVAWIFVAAMASLIVGLLFFLREILLATVSLRIGPRRQRGKAGTG